MEERIQTFGKLEREYYEAFKNFNYSQKVTMDVSKSVIETYKKALSRKVNFIGLEALDVAQPAVFEKLQLLVEEPGNLTTTAEAINFL